MKKLTPSEKREIEIDALKALREGTDPNFACPWPWTSEEGRHWVAVYLLNKGRSK
jgi:hypothetical protein